MPNPGLEIGDVALDLAQGRPVQVTGVYDGDAGEWSEENDYDLCGNYGNSRLDAQPDDGVVDCVYVSNIKSQPSKTYAFPESRLARIEVEAADDDGRIRERITRSVLESLFAAAKDSDEADHIATLADDAGLPGVVVDEAHELASVDAVLDGSDA